MAHDSISRYTGIDDIPYSRTRTSEARCHRCSCKDPEPVVRLHELADSSVNFVCRPWTKTENYWDVYWDVTKAVKERFDAEEVSIPFPQQDVHLFTDDQPLMIKRLSEKGSS